MSQRLQNEVQELRTQVDALIVAVAELQALLQAMTRQSTPKQGRAA